MEKTLIDFIKFEAAYYAEEPAAQEEILAHYLEQEQENCFEKYAKSFLDKKRKEIVSKIIQATA